MRPDNASEAVFKSSLTIIYLYSRQSSSSFLEFARRRAMTSSESVPRPRRRCSSTVWLGGVTNTVSRQRPKNRVRRRKFLDLDCPLHVNVQQNVDPAFHARDHFGFQRSVTVSVNRGELYEIPVCDVFAELFLRNEMVVFPVNFAGRAWRGLCRRPRTRFRQNARTSVWRESIFRNRWDRKQSGAYRILPVFSFLTNSRIDEFCNIQSREIKIASACPNRFGDGGMGSA